MFISLGIIVSHVFLIYLIRKQWDKAVRDGKLKDIVLDGLLAFEYGCLAMEQGVVLEKYGIVPWSCCLLSVIVWQVVAWPGYSASPISHLLKFSVEGLLRTGLMLVCSMGSYRYMSVLWEAIMTEIHRDRPLHLSRCSYPFTNTSTPVLFGVEFIGSLVLCILQERIFTNPTLVNNDPNRFIRGSIFAITVLFVVFLGMDVSGAMFNPTLATLLIGGCSGHTTSEHVTVYWVAPTLGAWAAIKYEEMLVKKKEQLTVNQQQQKLEGKQVLNKKLKSN